MIQSNPYLVTKKSCSRGSVEQSKHAVFKQLLDEVFVVPGIIKVEVSDNKTLIITFYTMP